MTYHSEGEEIVDRFWIVVVTLVFTAVSLLGVSGLASFLLWEWTWIWESWGGRLVTLFVVLFWVAAGISAWVDEE